MGSGDVIQVSELNLLSLTWTSWPPLTKVVYCHAYLPPKTHLSMSVVKGLKLSRFFSETGQSRSLLCRCWRGCSNCRSFSDVTFLWYCNEVTIACLSSCLSVCIQRRIWGGEICSGHNHHHQHDHQVQ